MSGLTILCLQVDEQEVVIARVVEVAEQFVLKDCSSCCGFANYTHQGGWWVEGAVVGGRLLFLMRKRMRAI